MVWGFCFLVCCYPLTRVIFTFLTRSSLFHHAFIAVAMNFYVSTNVICRLTNFVSNSWFSLGTWALRRGVSSSQSFGFQVTVSRPIVSGHAFVFVVAYLGCSLSVYGIHLTILHQYSLG